VSALRRLAGWLRDPVTWKSLVFLIAKLPMGVVALVALAGLGGTTLTIAAAPVLTTFTPVTVFGWELGSPGEALPLLVPGLLGVLLCLHLYNGLAWLYGLAARAMLGPGTAELHYRVDDLRDARARLIEAADAERRRIERDLHDGAQQRLVALALTLKVAETKVDDPAVARPLLVQARQEAEQANRELRELARGIHPAVLSDRGLGPALDALAARAPIPVEVSGVPAERLPPAVEAAAYFTTAEALTNVAKYAGAEEARVQLAVNDGRLSLSIADDGKGGAELERGSGLRGLRDRVEAVDGTFAVHSPPGQGTVIVAEIPLERP
jgi:signal transduction histidine kinase